MAFYRAWAGNPHRDKEFRTLDAAGYPGVVRSYADRASPSQSKNIRIRNVTLIDPAGQVEERMVDILVREAPLFTQKDARLQV